MTPQRAQAWSRRRFLAWPALAAVAEVQPSERVRYLDPSTDFEVFRVTDPKHSSILPPATNRVFPKRGGFLLYASDRGGGSLQPYTVDQKKWENRQVSEASALDPASLTLSPDDRSIVFADAADIRTAAIGGGSARTVHTLRTRPDRIRLSVTADGPSVLVADQNSLLMIPLLARGAPRKIAANQDGLDQPLARPNRASALYRSADSLWLANFDGSRQTRLKTLAGGLGPAAWSPDGRVVFYLHRQPGRAHTLRQNDPDTGEDSLLSITSQYAAFSGNRDASVFVGASESKAGPFVLLLVRSVRREFALCEHKATDSASVSPVFTPDSQKVFFQSDRHGKPAIYSMVIDRLVEKTEEEEAELERERSKPSR